MRKRQEIGSKPEKRVENEVESTLLDLNSENQSQLFTYSRCLVQGMIRTFVKFFLYLSQNMPNLWPSNIEKDLILEARLRWISKAVQ